MVTYTAYFDTLDGMYNFHTELMNCIPQAPVESTVRFSYIQDLFFKHAEKSNFKLEMKVFDRISSSDRINENMVKISMTDVIAYPTDSKTLNDAIGWFTYKCIMEYEDAITFTEKFDTKTLILKENGDGGVYVTKDGKGLVFIVSKGDRDKRIKVDKFKMNTHAPIMRRIAKALA